ncbi:hypothetical protein GOV04_00040 [Candidatus Woesearchaeota archaeon]|nr:hypothetical protein [Candidatus Woesearchaeota archaeon]
MKELKTIDLLEANTHKLVILKDLYEKTSAQNTTDQLILEKNKLKMKYAKEQMLKLLIENNKLFDKLLLQEEP